MKNKQEKKMKRSIHRYKMLRLLLIPLFILIAIIPSVMAHCPLCTGATIAGVGLTRLWGWDDSIVGVFVGGMIVSSALWFNNIFIKRGAKGNNFLRATALLIATFILTLITFYYAGFFGLNNPYRIFGIERIIFGTLSGSFISLFAFGLSNHLKKKNEGRVLFSYQTMILSVVALILNAGLFWIIFK